MSKQWYLNRQGRRYGPYSWEQMVKFAGTGQVVYDDLVWADGMPDWVVAAGVEGLFNARPPAQAEPSSPQPAPSPQQYASPEGEKTFGIIPGMRRKTGLISSKLYSLVVTERRLVFAEMTTAMLNQAAKEAAEEAKAQGKGFFARAADTMKSAGRIYQSYRQMTPEEILAETPGNFCVENREISSIRFYMGHFHEEQGQYDKDRMMIKTGREKIKLTFEYSNTNDAKRLLRGLLGKVVR